MSFLFGGGGGTTSTGSTTEIPQWIQDAGRRQYQTGTELGQIGYTPYYGADVAAFNPMQESAFRSTGTAADAFGMGPASTVPSGATFGPHSPTWATDGIPTAQTFAGNMRGYSGMPMYTQALNTLEEQRPYQKQQLEQQFIDPTTGLTPEGRKIQDINSLYNEAFGRNVGLEGVSTYLPLVQQGMTQNELRRVLYDSPEGRALGKSSLGAPIEIGVGGGLLGGAPYTPPVLPSGSSGILDSVVSPAVVPPTIADISAGAATVDPSIAAAAGQQMIGNTPTDTDLSTATPSTFDLYGSQIDQLMPIYQQELGRGIQDPAALAFYGDMLKNGVSPDEIRRQIAGSSEGQGFVTPAEQAAINAQNLGFGASSVTGNAFDDDAQLDVYNLFLEEEQKKRFANENQYINNDQGDLMEVFKDAEKYRQGFVNDLSGLLGSLTGNDANSLVSSSTTDSSYVNPAATPVGMMPSTAVTSPYGSNSSNNFNSLNQRMNKEDDYFNRFVSPY